MPAGTLIFPNDPNTVAALQAAGASAGITFQRNVAVPKPPTTRLSEAPKVGVLVNSAFANPTINDSIVTARTDIRRRAPIVSVLAGRELASRTPRRTRSSAIDVLYNTGQAYPAAGYTIATQANAGATSSGTTATITTTANNNLTVGATVTISWRSRWPDTTARSRSPRSCPTRSFSYTTPGADLAPSGTGSVGTQTRTRLNAFFARGGGYIGTSQSATNLSFLTGAVPALVAGRSPRPACRPSAAPPSGPTSAGRPARSRARSRRTDYLYLPSNVTYFSAIPTGPSSMASTWPTMGSAANPRGPTAGYVAGLWLNRDSAAALAVQQRPGGRSTGTRPRGSRYTGLAHQPVLAQ